MYKVLIDLDDAIIIINADTSKGLFNAVNLFEQNTQKLVIARTDKSKPVKRRGRPLGSKKKL
jgi:hypothetical protein